MKSRDFFLIKGSLFKDERQLNNYQTIKTYNLSEIKYDGFFVEKAVKANTVSIFL